VSGPAGAGTRPGVLSAIANVLQMILGLILDILTLPFRALFALIGGAEFEFRKFGKGGGSQRR
jgi:hypothetical protein